ncbi:MAG: hypothetical protein CML45_02355 [Rhodobacteraceae bacterium]|nr:hypothetical protein [Paracoccaceae bacterium]
MKNLVFIALIFVCLSSYSNESNYVFGWTQLKDSDLKKPRGGTSVGEKVTLDKEPNDLWKDLQKPELSKFEKDRLAILSMEGRYRVYFDFMETMGFVKDYVPTQPYQSWATEYVKIIENQKDFISLQHITVMYFKQADGQTSEPMVMKHWRQDWKYEDSEINTYVGNNTWVYNKISRKEKIDSWSQSVYQVDDTPRYQGYGNWVHLPNFSSWESNETWRPLPRREYSTRDDYDVMIGKNTQTITPTGWVHEQNNKKVISTKNKTVLAKEIGIARYERIKDFDWQVGLDYWDETSDFWKKVRSIIDNKLDNSSTFKLKSPINGEPLWSKLFMMADQHINGEIIQDKDIEKVINNYSLHN